MNFFPNSLIQISYKAQNAETTIVTCKSYNASIFIRRIVLFYAFQIDIYISTQ